jgi:hypothetical protein
VEVPEDITISTTASQVQISWSDSGCAISYKIYSSENPYSGFEEDTSGTFSEESWSAPIPNGKMFYNVKAVN